MLIFRCLPYSVFECKSGTIYCEHYCTPRTVHLHEVKDVYCKEEKLQTFKVTFLVNSCFQEWIKQKCVYSDRLQYCKKLAISTFRVLKEAISRFIFLVEEYFKHFDLSVAYLHLCRSTCLVAQFTFCCVIFWLTWFFSM